MDLQPPPLVGWLVPRGGGGWGWRFRELVGSLPIRLFASKVLGTGLELRNIGAIAAQKSSPQGWGLESIRVAQSPHRPLSDIRSGNVRCQMLPRDVSGARRRSSSPRIREWLQRARQAFVGKSERHIRG